VTTTSNSIIVKPRLAVSLKFLFIWLFRHLKMWPIKLDPFVKASFLLSFARPA
jgi:hypothetical protein